MSTTPAIVEVEPVITAVVRGTVPVAELAGFFDRSFSTLPQVVASQGAAIAGPAVARYDGPPTDVARLEVGFPTATPVRAEGEVEPSTLPGGRVARVEHHGSYEELGAAWEALAAWIAEQGQTPGAVLWEVYVTQPSPEMDPAELVTELSWLLDGA
jgi:effector-binding domain-containing protein